MAKVYGIDLGTTYSCIACLNAYGQPEVIPNFAGFRTTPSVVYFSPDQETCIVGESAKNSQVADYEETVSFIKREMEKDYAKPTKFPWGLTPTEISAYILRKLVDDANNYTDGPASYDVVITCPAYFGTVAREQTRQAGQIAGLNVLRVVNEPTAAAVAYGAALNQQENESKNIFVYDLGGGTFDISFINACKNEIEVLGTDGDSRLGGYDWDYCLAQEFLAEFNRANNTVLKFDGNQALLNHFMLEAEKCKIMLTSRNTTRVNLSWEGQSVRFEISREKFQMLTSDLLEKTISITQKLLQNVQAKKGIMLTDQVDVILVGGSSRMPQIQERLKDFFKDYGCSIRLRDPDECVAKGAALIADSQLVEKYQPADTPPIQLHDVTSKSYGLGIVSGEDYNKNLISHLIYKNTPLPVEKEDVFYTISNGQPRVSLRIYESDSEQKTIPVEEGNSLDVNHELLLPPNLPADTEIVVQFSLGTDGILAVTASYGDQHVAQFPVKIKGGIQEIDIQKAQTKMANTKFE